MESSNNYVGNGRYGPVANYELSFIREVITELEEGMPMRELLLVRQLKRTTVNAWIEKYASTELKNSRKRPSVQVKRSVVRAITSGTMSIAEVMRAYNISRPSIKEWLEIYQQQENCDLEVINVAGLNKRKSSSTQKTDNEQVKVLQQQLADAQLKIAALNTLIDVAEEQLKINIRKKPGARQS